MAQDNELDPVEPVQAGGLINSAAGNSNATWNPSTGVGSYPTLSATPAQSTTTDATAATRAVDPNEVLSNQINNVISQDGPLMQQAATLAKQQSNARGLLNSSMAIGAGQNAVLSAATPIAQHQANAVTSVLDKNQSNEQAADQFNAQAQNNNSIVNASEQNKILAQMLDGNQRMQLADIEAQYKTLMQSQSSAMSTYQQSIKNISEILMNPDLDAAAKQKAVANQNQLLKTGMDLIAKMSGLNLGDLLQFPEYE